MKRIRHARRAFETHRPLFPGYLFVERTEPFMLRPILGTYGVRSVVRTGDSPGFLPASFVASLKDREAAGVIPQPEATLQPGQSVVIDGGLFDGVVGEILQVRESDRVLLLLDLIHSQTRLNVDAKRLRSA